MKLRYLVMAGNFQQARYWMDREGVPQQEWRYIGQRDHLRGWRGIPLRRVGSWWTAPADVVIEADVYEKHWMVL
jgi:hypothetical protein